MRPMVWMLATLACGLAWTGCATRSGPPRAEAEVIPLSEAGKAAYQAGLLPKAKALYRQAYQRSQLLALPMEVARNGYNLGMCLLALGETKESRRLFDEACALVPESPERGAFMVAGAEAALRDGDPAACEALARQVLSRKTRGVHGCQAAVLMGELALEKDDMEAAATWYRQAKACAGTALPAALGARCEGMAARLVSAGAIQGDAAGHRLAQAGHLREAGLYREMALAFEAAGDAFKASGRKEKAFDSYERAARSLAAAGERRYASKVVLGMRDLASALGGVYGTRQQRLEAAMTMNNWEEVRQ